jgi:membrane protease YdiL (CAAX protease family)
MGTTSSDRPWWEGDYVLRPKGEELSSEPPAPESIPVLSPDTGRSTCWRCGEAVEEGRERCPSCDAWLVVPRKHRREPSPLPEPTEGDPVLPMIGFYIALLFLGIVTDLLAKALTHRGNATSDRALVLVTLADVVSSVLVVVAVGVVPRPPRLPRRSTTDMAAAWSLALPVLAGLFAINMVYHQLLQEFVGERRLPESGFGLEPNIPMLILLVCVQPAVFEELFFRYLALGALYRHVGVHGAVLLSSVMFAFAHLFQPWSMPLFFVIGTGLGYMRVASRSVVLPMLMHFLHNLAVVLLVISR